MHARGEHAFLPFSTRVGDTPVIDQPENESLLTHGTDSSVPLDTVVPLMTVCAAVKNYESTVERGIVGAVSY